MSGNSRLSSRLVDESVFKGTVRTVTPTGTSADAANIQAALTAMAGVGRVKLKAGTYSIAGSTSIYVPSNTILECDPGVRLVSTLASGGTFDQSIPFYAKWTAGNGTKDTTLSSASVIGSPTVSLTKGATVMAAGDWVMIGDATVSSCEVFKVVSVADGGATWTVTLDRPCELANAGGQPAVVLAAIPHDIRLHFNGAVLTGSGREACVLLAARDCIVTGLTVDASAGTLFDQYNGVQFNDGCRNCHAYDCITDGLGVAGSFEGPHIANSIDCSFVNYRVSRLPSTGITLAGTIRCGVVAPVIDNCTTGVDISALASPANNSRDNYVRDAKITRGTDGVAVQTGVRGTILANISASKQTVYCVAIYAGSIATFVDGLKTNGAGSYDMRVETDATIRSWKADNGTTGRLLCTAASPAKVTVDGFLWGMDSTTLTPYGVVATSTARIELRNGRSTVDAAGGSATAYAAGACTIVRDSVQTYGRGGYYSDAVNSMLIDRSGVDDSACTVANVFGAGAHANYGTITTNGTTGVVTNYRGMKATSQIVFSIGTVGGTPSPTYISALTAGTSFTTKASAGDTSTVIWKDVLA